ncbi:uncharacterized protein PAC_13059 [Phialocephala subalpina]|uniref:Uncharacterized protein n=1 Tax=Phialocephala subalpina TaxID=576137 RepID=A0A1L7XDR9_9HELO|nr:uncharacterized protein PAC_13059 [Phialocephala subalpina]
MMPVSLFVLWAALQYGSLVAGDDILPGMSRVFLNTTSATLTSSESSTTSSVPLSTVKPLGVPDHGPTHFTGTLSTSRPVVTVIGGHTVTDGSYVDSMGDTVTVATSFSLSPVGVSLGIPTENVSTLPWTGRILTDPVPQTSNIISSSLASESFLVSTAAPSNSSASAWPSTASVSSNSSTSKLTNTTWSSTTSLVSGNRSSTPTSIIIATPGNLTIYTSVATVTPRRGNISLTSTSYSATYTLFQNVSTCSTLPPDEPVTVWVILPNTTTTTMTVTGNLSTSFTTLPEFTPPVYCPTPTYTLPPGGPTSGLNGSSVRTSAAKSGPQQSLSISTTVPLFIMPPHPTVTTTVTDSSGLSSTIVYIPGYSSVAGGESPGRLTITSITTSKNGITEITSATLPSYGNPNNDKVTVTSSSVPPDSNQWVPQTEPSHARPTPITTIYAGNPAATTPLTEVVGGVTVVAAPSKAIIGSQTVVIGPAPQTVTEAGQTFTVLPNEIDGPSVVISIPTYTAGGVFVESPSPTTINGVSIGIGGGSGGSTVVIGGTSFDVGPGAPEKTVVAKGQTIVVGSGGIQFDSTTITAAPNPASTPTNIAVVGGSIITAVGSSVAVIDGQTITYGPSTPQTTTIFNGETITIGPAGVVFHGSTIGGTALNPASSQIGIVGGVSITEIGSSIAVIAGTTFTIGPGAKPTTATISGQTVSAGPDGLSDGAFSWNPFPSATQTLTAGGITFSELGSSLVVIGSQTFTIGPGAKPTTDVYGGQTISIGPGGVGFSTTTFTNFGAGTGTGTATGTAAGTAAGSTTTTKKKNGAEGLSRPAFGVLGIFMVVSIGWLL